MAANVILIIVDALRARNLSCYGHTKKTSPNIDKLASEGVLFENAYSCINTTDPSLLTMYTGKFPKSHGVVRHAAMMKEEDLKKIESQIFLAELLKKEGFSTLAIDWLGRWHKRGFDYYSGVESSSPLTKLRKFVFNKKKYITCLPTPIYSFLLRMVPEKFEDAKSVTKKAISTIRDHKEKNFFLFVHYWDTHSPFGPPKNKGVRYNGPVLDKIKNDKRREYVKHLIEDSGGLEELLDKYDNAISTVDKEIGRMISMLENLDILDNTLIIITADHGESLQEHNIFFDHHGLYDESIHVPLIFVHPSLLKGKRITGFVQHIDLLPTILDHLDIDTELEFDGKSLMPLIFDDNLELHSYVFAEEAHVQRKYAIRNGKFKYIVSDSEKGAICRYCGTIHGDFEELYDLEKDPSESNNIVKDSPDIVKDFNEKLKEIRERGGATEIKKNKVRTSDEDQEVLDRLKDLGYV